MSRRNIPTSPLLTLSPSPGRWSSGCGYAVRGLTAGDSAWKECARRRGRNTRVRYRKQLAKNEYWVQGIAVTPYGRSGHLPAGSRQEGFSTTMRARTAQLYLPEAASGCPSSARAGPPVGAKEGYNTPNRKESGIARSDIRVPELCEGGCPCRNEGVYRFPLNS